MSAKCMRSCSLVVCMIVGVFCVNVSAMFAQSGGGVDGGGDEGTFTQAKSNSPTVAVNVAAQPALSRSLDVSAEALDRDTEAKLAMAVGDNFRFDESPFLDVMNQIKNDANLNIVLDASAEGDLDYDTGIVFNIQGISLEKSLEMLLRKYNCDFIVDHGVVRIISLDVAGDPDFHMMRIYDCSRLIQAVPSLTDRPTPPKGPASGSFSAESKATVNLNSPPTAEPTQNRSVGLDTRLVKLITDTVTPDEWSLTGTGDGVINQVGNCLIVTQSRGAHRAVQNLISQMESKLIQK